MNLDVTGDSNLPARPQRKHPRLSGFSVLALTVLVILSLGLFLLPVSDVHIPHLVVDAGEGLEVEFLLSSRTEKSACTAATSAMATSIQASCRTCTIRTATCVSNPSEKLLKRFGEEPLNVPSARLPNGIVTYAGTSAKAAFAACKESERQANLNVKIGQAKVLCFQAGTTRQRSEFEVAQDHAGYRLFSLLLAGVAGLAMLIAATILVGCAKNYLNTAEPRPRILSAPLNGFFEKLVLGGVDGIVLTGIFLALSWPLQSDFNRWSDIDRTSVIAQASIIVLTLAWFGVLLEQYSRRRPFWDELREIFSVLTVMFILSSAIAFVVGFDVKRTIHLLAWVFAFILVPLARFGMKRILDDLGLWKKKALIVGSGENAKSAYLALKSERGMGYDILGFVNPLRASGNRESSTDVEDKVLPIYFADEAIEELLVKLGNPQVIIALDSLGDSIAQEMVQDLLLTRRDIHIIPSLRGLPLFGTQLSHFFSQEVLFLTIRNNLARLGYQFIKRVFDFVGATLLLIVLSPLMVYVTWLIWREDGFPVLYKQSRAARRGGEFRFLKFRTMVRDADAMLKQWQKADSLEWQEYCANNFKLKNDPRVLKIGRWLRSTSIDELPQLINVLKGEMSLVGPRPLLANELQYYGRSINLYRQARPGITGLWQISGRSHTQFRDRAALDEWYVQNWSLWYDIAILFKTIDVVFRKEGAY